MKTSPKTALPKKLAALFFAAAALAGCGDNNVPATNDNGATVKTGIHSTDHVDRRYLVTLDDLAIRTATGRTLHVTAQAYCQTEIGRRDRRTPEDYKAACRASIAERLLYAARHEDGVARFESFLAMGSKEIRPYNYFDEPMMLRALPLHYRQDLYTVTDLRDCATGARVPEMNPRPAPPPGGWPDAEERRQRQTATPQAGLFRDGRCTFD